MFLTSLNRSILRSNIKHILKKRPQSYGEYCRTTTGPRNKKERQEVIKKWYDFLLKT